MERYMPLPDISSELHGSRTTKQILLQDMDCVATEMYRFLPNADFMTDDFRLKFIKRFLKERDIVKNSLTSFQEMIKEYKLYRYVEERRRARLRIPEIVKDKARIDEIFRLGETVLEVLKEQKFPSQLTMTVPRCMERIRNNFRIDRINITRDMVKALKLIKLGTEKENKHDATFLVHIGIKNLKEAVSKEFARANSKY